MGSKESSIVQNKVIDLSLDDIDVDGPSDDESNDDEWESATIPPPPESKRPTMVALYDYEAEDDEELSFSADDVITQLEPEDSKGCVRPQFNSLLESCHCAIVESYCNTLCSAARGCCDVVAQHRKRSGYYCLYLS